MSYNGTQARSGVGAQILIGLRANVSPPVYTHIGEVQSADLNGCRKDINDVTNYDSGNPKEFIGGSRDNGTITLTLNRVSTDGGQQALDAAFKDLSAYSFLEILPATPTLPGWILRFNALVISRNYDLDPHKNIAPQLDLKISGDYTETVLGPGQQVPYTNATGTVVCYSSGPLAEANPIVRWSNFQFPLGYALPPDAVIQAIYPVWVASATYYAAYSYYSYGNNPATGFGSASEGTDFYLPMVADSATFPSTVFYGTSIGTSLASVTGYKIKMYQAISLRELSLSDRADATAVGFAIYYTSAIPAVSSQMPAPVTVPAGQGVAWMLPMTVEQTGAGPLGNFAGYGTAATL